MLTPYEVIVVKEALEAHRLRLQMMYDDAHRAARTALALRQMQRAEKDLRTIEKIRGKL